MTFTDAIWINAPSRRIWEHVGSPDRWPRFYERASRCERVSSEGGVVGSLYDIELGPRGYSTAARLEIVDLCPGSMIAVKWTLDEKSEPMMARGWTMQITYEVEYDSVRTRVTERVEMSGMPGFPVNWFTKAMGWLIYRFRKLAGNTNLQRLKGVVEGTL